MFEGVVAPIINQILGQYIENVESSNVSVAVWTGDVVLHNVRLRREALNQFNLPIEVLEGYLGDLTLSIPWSDIKNKPVKIAINNLLILSAPKGEREYDAKSEQEYDYQVKMNKINAMEASAKDTGLSNEQNATFMSQLVTKIVDNVQISIKNIHIRYEDKISDKDPFSVGLSIEELSGHSTDENWTEAFISTSTGIIHKFLKLSNLAVYWNTDNQSFTGLTPSEFRDALMGTIIKDSGGPVTWQYGMRPVSGVGKVKICRRPEYGQAKYATDLNFEDLAFVMDDIQYATFFSLFNSFNLYIRASMYRKFRPSLTKTPKTNPRDWFKYAGTAILSDIKERNRRWTWQYLKERRDDRNNYIDVFTKCRRGTASSDELSLQMQLERKLSYSDIRLYRYIANEYLVKEDTKLPEPSTPKASSPSKSWGEWWYGSSSAVEAASSAVVQIDPSQLKQIYETIDFNPERAFTEDFSHPEDILVDLCVKLKHGSATLKKNVQARKDVMVRMKFEGFSATVIQRPTSWFFNVDLLKMALEDKSSPGSLFPRVISSQIQEKRDDPFFSLTLEINPLDQRADHSLTLKMLPLEIVINPKMIEAVAKFFKPPPSDADSLYVIQAFAKDKLSSLAQQTRAGLNFAIEQHKTLELKVDVDAPIFILPENCGKVDTWMVFMNAGHLSIHSETIAKLAKQDMLLKNSESIADTMLKEAGNLLYDKFHVALTSVQVIIDRSLDKCRSCITEDGQTSVKSHFLEQMDASFCVELSIIPELTEFAKVKIHGSLPRLHVNVTDQRYHVFRRILIGVFSALESIGANSPALESFSETRYPVSSIQFSDGEEEDEFQDASEEFLSEESEKPSGPNPYQVSQDIKFLISEVSMTLISDTEYKTEALCDIILSGLNAECIIRRFDASYDFRIKNSQIVDRFFLRDFILAPLSFDEKDAYLVYCRYKLFQNESPGFRGLNDVMELGIASMAWTIAPRSVVPIYEFVTNTFTRLQPSSPQSKISEPTTSVSEKVKRDSNSNKKGRFEVNMSKMTVKMFDSVQQAIFSTANFDTMHFTWGYSGLMQTAEGTIGKLSLLDNLCGDKLFSQILSIDGNRLIDFKFDSGPTLKSDSIGSNLNVKGASIRAFYSPRFICNLQSFFSRFHMLYTYMEAATTSAVVSANKIAERSDIFSFNLDIQTPVIMLSRSLVAVNIPNDESLLYIYPGSISIANESVGSDSIRLALTKMRITTCSLLNGKIGILYDVVKDADVTVKCEFNNGSLKKVFTRRFAAMNVKLSKIQIVASVSDLNIKTDQDQYDFLIEFYRKMTSATSQPATVSPSSTKLKEKVSSNTQSISSECHIEFSHVTMEIVKGRSTSEAQIFRIFALNPAINYNSYSDSSSRADIRIDSCVLTDASTMANVHADIISSSNEGPQVNIRYTQPRTGSSRMVFVWESAILIWNLQFLSRVSTFFSRPWLVVMPGVQPSNYTPFYEFQFMNPEVIMLETKTDPMSEAIVIRAKTFVLTLDALLSMSVTDMTMSLSSMHMKQSVDIKLTDCIAWSLTIDSQSLEPGTARTHMLLDLSPVTIDVTLTDMPVVYKILYQNIVLDSSFTAEESVSKGLSDGDSKLTQMFRCDFQGVRVILIDDLATLHVPVSDLSMNQLSVTVSDWSGEMHVDLNVSFEAKYFNLHNSHWEPLIESCTMTLGYNILPDSKTPSLNIFAPKKLELDISCAFLEYIFDVLPQLQDENLRDLMQRSGHHALFTIQNRTGYPIYVWADSTGDGTDTELFKIRDGEDKPWHFDDWSIMRKKNSTIPSHKISVQIDGPTWETIKAISVDVEGASIFPLLPKVNNVAHLLVCDVTLENKLKTVTLRSPNVVVNNTAIPLEMIIVNDAQQQVGSVMRIEASANSPVPLGSGFYNSIRVRPAGLGHKWSQLVSWKHIMKEKMILISCSSDEPNTAPYRFQINSDELHSETKWNYPLVSMCIQAPLQIENLLPYDIKYLVYDRTTKQNLVDVLKQGEINSLHTVDRGHILALSVQLLKSDFKPSSVALISNTDLDFRDDVIEMKSNTGRDVLLGLRYSDDHKRSGYKVTIFAPYIILNNTGLNLTFRSKTLMGNSKAVTVAPKTVDDDKGPFLFSHPSADPIRGRAQVSVTDSDDWSKPFSLDAVGTSTAVSVPFKQNGAEVDMGMSVQEGEGKYFLTRVISFTPRIIIQSNMLDDIQCRLRDTNTALILRANSKMYLTHFSENDEGIHQMSIRISSRVGEWSKLFTVNEIGRTFIKCGRLGSTDEDLLRLDITEKGASFYVFVARQDGKWPFRIDNQSTEDFVVWQQAPDRRMYIVPKNGTIQYAWDDVAAPRKLLVVSIAGQERVVDLLRFGKQDALSINGPGNKIHFVEIQVVAEGPVIVLKVSSLGMNGDLPSTLSKLNDMKEKRKSLFDMNVHFAGIGISLINTKVRELMYISAKEVDYNYCDSTQDKIQSFGMKWIQIDNQMTGNGETIVVYPTVLPTDDKEDTHPVLMASVCVSKDKSYGVEYYEWLTVLLQELSVSLDENFLNEIMNFARTISPFKSAAPSLIPTQSVAATPKPIEEGEIMYFDRLLLHPIQINITFAKSQKQKRERSANRPRSNGFFSFLTDILTMTIGNIHDAPIRLNALELQHANGPFERFANLIFQFYSQETVGQLHKVVGSADVLGNPVKLFNTVSSGVSDLFYEPLQGFEITRPQDFGIGVIKGASSLVQKTVFGVTDTLSKISGSLGKGLSVITMDEKFQRSRMTSRNRPKHAVDGVATGAVSLAKSVASGVTGIVSKPFEGARDGGFEGFFKGIGKGIVGVVAKPVVGVFDLASNVTEGIRNTTQVSEKELDRQRLPRFIGKDKVLRPYDPRAALGWDWLQHVGEGKFAQEDYMELFAEDYAVIVTDARVLMIRTRRLDLEWNLPFDDMQLIRMEKGVITLVKSKPGSHPKIIPCPDPTAAKALVSRIEEAFSRHLSKVKWVK